MKILLVFYQIHKIVDTFCKNSQVMFAKKSINGKAGQENHLQEFLNWQIYSYKQSDLKTQEIQTNEHFNTCK